MANTDIPNGFLPTNKYDSPKMTTYSTTGGIKRRDMVYLTTAGTVAIATASTTAVLGVAAGTVPAGANGNTTDDIQVWDDPDQEFVGQTSGTGAGMADVHDTSTAANAFDIEGTTGIMEINEDSSAHDICMITGVGTDLATGDASADGANQRLKFVIQKHQLSTVA